MKESQRLPEHSRNYYYREVWRRYQVDKKKLSEKARAKIAQLLIDLRESGKVHDVRPWAKSEWPRVYFKDKSYIALNDLTHDWTHSGEGSKAQAALNAIGYPRASLSKSVFESIRRE